MRYRGLALALVAIAFLAFLALTGQAIGLNLAHVLELGR